jgi:hypothetical protein
VLARHRRVGHGQHLRPSPLVAFPCDTREGGCKTGIMLLDYCSMRAILRGGRLLLAGC